MLEIAQLITKEKGRELIKSMPLWKMEYLSRISINSLKMIDEIHNHYVTIMNNSMKINVSTHTALLSLFNDMCPCCGKVFTHYALINSYKCIDKNGKKVYQLIPCNPDTNGDFVFYNKDHIIPQSCNGVNKMINLQFMCKNYNSKKSAIITDEELKYGYYRKGIFHNIKNNDILNINDMKIKISSVEQVKGGLFYLMSDNVNTYFDCNGKSIDGRFKIKGVNYGEY